MTDFSSECAVDPRQSRAREVSQPMVQMPGTSFGGGETLSPGLVGHNLRETHHRPADQATPSDAVSDLHRSVDHYRFATQEGNVDGDSSGSAKQVAQPRSALQNRGGASCPADPIDPATAPTSSTFKSPDRRGKAKRRAKPTGDAPSPTPLSDGVEAAAGDDRAHTAFATHRAREPAIAEIIQLVRMRRRWIKAKNALVLQAKALCRGWTEGDKDEANRLYDAVSTGEEHDPILGVALSPFIGSIEHFVREIAGIEKTLMKLGARLPVWASFGKDVKGLSSLGLAIIVGECGDIGSYRNPSCLWKRMGLAVNSGRRQGNPGPGATAEDWTEEAYSGARRSVMWNIGNSLIGGMGKFRPLMGEDVAANPDYSPYQRIFTERVRYEAERLPHKDGTAIKTSATGKESYTAHAANRAKRYVEKRLLRDFYAAWRALDREDLAA